MTIIYLLFNHASKVLFYFRQIEKQYILSLSLSLYIYFLIVIFWYCSKINSNVDLCMYLWKPYTELFLWTQIIEAIMNYCCEH